MSENKLADLSTEFAIQILKTKSAVAEEIHLRWMKSLRDEIRLRREQEADFISYEAVRRIFHPNKVRISSCVARFH